MLKSTRLRKQRKARSKRKQAVDVRLLNSLKTELIHKLETELSENAIVAFEVPREKVSILLEIFDDDFKMMYNVRQISQTVYEFSLREIL